MTRLPLVAMLFVAACACGKQGGGTGPGTGSGTGSGTAATATCEGVRAHVEELYRAAAPAPSAGSGSAVPVDTVPDDVAMVMKDCAAEPGRVAPCAAAATSTTDLEQRCLIPIDDEGSEGDRFKGG